MALLELNTNPSRRELLWFGLLWFPAFWGVLGGLLWYYDALLRNEVFAIWGTAAGVSLVGLLVRPILRGIFVVWMVAVYPIGWMISHLLLVIIFYGVITPLGLFMRLLGRDSMQRRVDASVTTAWKSLEERSGPEEYFRQY